MRLRISKLDEMAKDRPPGYIADVLEKGVVEGDFLEISPEALAALREKYRPEPPLPSLPARARNLAVQSAKEGIAILQGVPAPTEEEISRRLAICNSNVCGNWRASDETCALCGCPMVKKTTWRSAVCLAAKW